MSRGGSVMQRAVTQNILYIYVQELRPEQQLPFLIFRYGSRCCKVLSRQRSVVLGSQALPIAVIQ